MSVNKSVTAATLDQLNQAIGDDFQDALQNTPVAVEAFTGVKTTNADSGNFPLRNVTSGMKKWIDTKKVGNIKLENIPYVIYDWEDTIEIPRNAILDDQLGFYTNVGKDMGRSGRLLKQDRVVYAMQNGTSNSTSTFDGKATFATDHPLNPAAVQSNLFTSTALSAANFATVRAAFESYLGTDGKPLGVQLTQLIVPPQLRKTGEDILKAEFVPGGNGGSNVLVNSAELVVVPALANEPTVWYVACKVLGDPAIWIERAAPTVTALLDPQTENVFWRKQYVWSVEARGEAIIPLWFLMARCSA